MIITVRHIFVLGMILGLTGCGNSVVGGENGYIRNRVGEYVVGESVPPLTMPRGVAQLPPDPYYPIPDVANPGGIHVTLVPPGSLLMQQAKDADLAHKQAGAPEAPDFS